MGLVEVGARLVVQERARYVRDLQTSRGATQQLGDTTSRAGRQAADAGAGFDTAGRKARDMGGAVSSGLGALGRGITLVTGAATAAISAAGTVGVRTYAQLEQAEIGFTTMLGSAEAADRFLTDLGAFASKTPFEFPELQTAASSLVSAGVEAGKVIPIMTSLGNATSGMGTGAVGVQRATTALQQMNAAGKITGEDLNQLRDAGIPVYDLLAAATGKSKEAVTELAAKGKLGRKELEQLMTALETGKGLERFAGLMEKQSSSINGMVSTLRDTVSMGLAAAIDDSGADDLIKSGLGGAITYATDLMPRLTSGLTTGLSYGRQLYGILFQGDYTGGLVAGMSEDDQLVTRLFDLRESAIGLYDVLFRGDFTGPIFGLQEDHPAIGVLFSVRDAARDAGTWLRDTAGAVAGGDLGAAGDQFASIGDSLVELAPAARSFADTMPSLTTTVDLAAGSLGFLADHTDTLIRFMPLIVGGVVAFKVAQMAANVVQAATVPLRIAEIVANRQLAKALKEVAAAQIGQTVTATAATTASGASTAATTAATTATGRGRTATAALTTATKVQTVASKAGALALRGVGLAVRFALGPVGLIITGVGLLAAGLVYAYKNSETFRDVVNGAFTLVKQGVGNAVGFIITGFRGLLTVWLTVAEGIVKGAAKALGWVPGLGDKLKAADAAFGELKDGILGKLDSAAQAAYGFGEKTASNLAAGFRAGRTELSMPVVIVAGQRTRGDVLTGGIAGARADGGPVAANRAYLVGERGPELMVPRVPGVVLPDVPRISLPAGAGGGDGGQMPVWTGDLHVHPSPGMDEQELADKVVDELERRLARR